MLFFRYFVPAMPLLHKSCMKNPPSKACLGEGVTHFGEPFRLTEEVVDSYRDLAFRTDGPGRVVLDMGDEVISSKETLDTVVDLPILTFPGGSHRFDHMEELVGLLLGPEG